MKIIIQVLRFEVEVIVVKTETKLLLWYFFGKSNDEYDDKDGKLWQKLVRILNLTLNEGVGGCTLYNNQPWWTYSN